MAYLRLLLHDTIDQKIPPRASNVNSKTAFVEYANVTQTLFYFSHIICPS